MADIVNPYANPYLPSFVSQRPRMAEPTTMTPTFGVQTQQYGTIHQVNGFQGARDYAKSLLPGNSEIVAESDPNLSRIYIVAKDQNQQIYMEAYNLTPEVEPKAVTMEDLSAQMNELLGRMNRLEEDKRNDQSNHGAAWKNKSGNAANGSNGRSNAGSTESSSGN